MTFNPPKWYRLSIHPDTVIFTTPWKDKSTADWSSLPFTLVDLKAKLKISPTKLAQLPIQKMKTHIFTTIPWIFEE